MSADEAQLWCQENRLPYFETSAKDNTGVEEAFLALVEKYIEMEGKMDTRQRAIGETIDLRTKKATDGGCCS